LKTTRQGTAFALRLPVWQSSLPVETKDVVVHPRIRGVFENPLDFERRN
jgi:hypothetical protein